MVVVIVVVDWGVYCSSRHGRIRVRVSDHVGEL